MNGKNSPYKWNHSIEYENKNQRMPFVAERLAINNTEVTFDEATDIITYRLMTSIAKGTDTITYRLMTSITKGSTLSICGICKLHDELIRKRAIILGGTRA